MKNSRLLVAVCACLAALLYNPVQASVLTFDELTHLTPIPDGYGGLDWGNMFSLNPNSESLYENSGYRNGLVSGEYVAYNLGGGLAVTSGNAGAAFDFIGAYLAGAWNNGLNINIKGYHGTSLLYDNTVVVDTTGASWFQLDYLGVNKLEFTSSGGVDVSVNGSGEQFAMDNFTFGFVPIPPAIWLFGSGVLGLIGIARRT